MYAAGYRARVFPPKLPTWLRYARLPVVLAVCVALTMTRCSSGEPENDPPADVMAALVDAVGEQESVRLTLGTKLQGDQLQVDTAWDGAPRFRALSDRGTFSELDVRLVEDRVYVGGEVTGNQWTYLDVDAPELEPDSGFDAGPVPTLLAIDVPGDLAALEEAVTATEGGADGEYTLTVDTQKWFDNLDESSMYAGMDLPDTVEMSLRVDQETDLPIQLSYQVPGEDEQSAEIGWSKWGEPVEVTVPKRATPAI